MWLAVLMSRTPAAAQEWTGNVLRPGEAGVTLGGDYGGYRSLWYDDVRLPLGAGVGGVFDPTTFPPLTGLPAAMEAFLATTDSVPFPVTDADFIAGSLDARLAANDRTGIARLGIGVLPRVELGIAGSIMRSERLPLRVELMEGSLGVNPDRMGNADLLALVDTVGGAALGSSAMLPLEGSRLGARLQEVVFAATGDSLALPTAGPTLADLATGSGFSPIPHEVSPIRVGDLELDARLELLRTFPGPYEPTEGDGTLNARLAVRGVVRLGVGEVPPRTPRTDWSPLAGHGGLGAGAILDLFGGRRLHLTLGANWLRLDAATLQLPLPVDGIPGTATGFTEAGFEPGATISYEAIPRLRLTEEISIGGTFRTVERAEGAWEIEGARTPIPERSARAAGFMIGYSSLAAYQAGRTRTPIEASIGFASVIDGSGGVPAARLATVRVTILRRLWGGSSESTPVE